MQYRLVIGNKNTSSWSMRPWLAMRQTAIPFAEINIDLSHPDAKSQIRAQSPSGKVPALLVDGQVIWDSLAIIEYLAAAHPEAGLWPEMGQARTAARCVSAEMHSGFAALREHCPMDLLARLPQSVLPTDVATDVLRIVEIWRDCRSRFGSDGQFLFGRFSAADAMYAPVASRFQTYLPDLGPFGDDGTARAYVDALFALPVVAQWQEEARAEIARAG